MSKPNLPDLPEPSAAARKPKTGRQARDKPIYVASGGEGFGRWEVEVTPLRNATNIGRGIDAIRRRPRALFEVRALYYGPGLPEFGSQPNTRLVPHTHTEDEELALVIARMIEELLRNGNREFDFREVARDAERRRK